MPESQLLSFDTDRRVGCSPSSHSTHLFADSLVGESAKVGSHSLAQAMLPTPAICLVAQCENHIHRGLDFDGFAIEQLWTVAPVAHCAQCCLLQHYWTAHYTQVLNRSRLGDGGLQHYRSLGMHRHRDRWIKRGSFLQQQARDHT